MKQKVVNTRIDEDLYEKISAKAKKNRVTISNLIRNLVEDSIEISNDALDLVDERIKKHIYQHNLSSIVGYQSLVLVKDTVCNFCGKELIKGTSSHVVTLENSSKKPIICDDCKKKQEKGKNDE